MTLLAASLQVLLLLIVEDGCRLYDGVAVVVDGGGKFIISGFGLRGWGWGLE